MKKRIVRLFTMAGVMMLLVALMAMPAYFVSDADLRPVQP